MRTINLSLGAVTGAPKVILGGYDEFKMPETIYGLPKSVKLPGTGAFILLESYEEWYVVSAFDHVNLEDYFHGRDLVIFWTEGDRTPEDAMAGLFDIAPQEFEAWANIRRTIQRGGMARAVKRSLKVLSPWRSRLFRNEVV